MRHKWQVKKQQKTSEPQCKKKRQYKSIDQAWTAAAYYFVRYDTLQAPYKCPCGEHYHLTAKTKLGNLSHIPEEWRPLFITKRQRNPGRSFWQKLRDFLV